MLKEVLVGFRPLSREPFFKKRNRRIKRKVRGFRPLSREPFFKACLQSPSPSALASAFAAGMGGSLHQALSFGDEMPIFPGRAGIGGDLQ